MNRKVLFVDDDPNILQGYKRTLRGQFEIQTADGGAEGLASLANAGPFAVVVSDMRMPGMDGVQFLAHAKEQAPLTVRMMLTGNSDQLTALQAVNQGHIFRFLTKPCPPDLFAQALEAGLEQYRLLTAEKDLLEQTLNHSLQVLMDILALVNPTAFSRAARLRRLARKLALRLTEINVWEVEVAALLSQIGCVTVPEETLAKLANGAPIEKEEQRMIQQYPQVGRDLLARIPRMETVSEMIAYQHLSYSEICAAAQGHNAQAVITGASILKLAFDFDQMRHSGCLPHQAYQALTERPEWYEPRLLAALRELLDQERGESYLHRTVNVMSLRTGMLLDEPVITARGVLLVVKGQEVTRSLVQRLSNFVETGVVEDQFKVLIPNH
jgi:response regulator RpfG family c-di-GMP phosphodiesterase